MEEMNAKAAALYVMTPMEAKPAKTAGDESAMKAIPSQMAVTLVDDCSTCAISGAFTLTISDAALRSSPWTRQPTLPSGEEISYGGAARLVKHGATC